MPARKEHVTQLEWEAKRFREPRHDTQPCNEWQAKKCSCGGACGCHWVIYTTPTVVPTEIRS